MKNRLFQFLLVTLAVFCPSMRGQGFYTTYQMDGLDFIQTDAVAYPSSGTCGSSRLDVWNDFNGDYVSGYAPTDQMSGTYASDGVSYDWTYGYHYPFWLKTGCAVGTINWHELLGFAVTTARNAPPYISDVIGYCPQTTQCTNTSTPRCPISQVYVGAPGVSCVTTSGTAWREYLVFILGGTCVGGPAVLDTTGPEWCTPQ